MTRKNIWKLPIHEMTDDQKQEVALTVFVLTVAFAMYDAWAGQPRPYRE